MVEKAKALLKLKHAGFDTAVGHGVPMVFGVDDEPSSLRRNSKP
jgi:hypothetical protein